MLDAVIVLILFSITAGIIFYIAREKRRGVKCIGCPHASECKKKRSRYGVNP